MQIFLEKTTYDYQALKPVFFALMDLLGGGIIHRQSRVLIKPNLLSPAPPKRAILTHPLFVKAAVEYVLERGGKPLVADSPAIGSFERTMKVGGFDKVLAGLPVECRGFMNSHFVDLGPALGKVELAVEALEAEIIINLPKLKTHSQMLLTLGVKNMFGCVVGFKKPEWHMKLGARRDLFAELLVKIYEEIRPGFTILDGVLALEGEGPGRGGKPREMGIIMASTSAHALDLAVCQVLGIDPQRAPTVQSAIKMGLVSDPVNIKGDWPKVDRFLLPPMAPLIYGPKRFHNFIRQHLLQRPVCGDSQCTLCGDCAKICPAKAISYLEKGLKFDYNLCIRCYCCQEICPEGAIKIKDSRSGKALGTIFARFC